MTKKGVLEMQHTIYYKLPYESSDVHHTVRVEMRDYDYTVRWIKEKSGVILKVTEPVNRKNIKYNGWANYETWNVALWIQNTEPVYRAAVEYVKSKPNKRKVRYNEFILENGMDGARTGDGVMYSGTNLSLPELNGMLREIWSDFKE